MRSFFLTMFALLLLTEAAFAEDLYGMKYQSSMDIEYAEGFTVEYYEDGYKLIKVKDGQTVLVVPKGKEVPSGVDDSVVILKQPLDTIYLANSAAMSLFDAMDALDNVKYTSLAADNWYVENAAAAMRDGKILFAGKYSEPDYEMLVSGGCCLAIENTMISHSPKIQEMLEMLGIPVFVDRGSYEAHPLGKVEWIRLYGAMLNKEDAAKAQFDEQCSEVEALQGEENTGKTVAFFYVNDDETVVVRGSGDYVPKMIEIAGAKYIFSDTGDSQDNDPSVTMSMEQFYASAIDADVLIYNGTMESIASVDELLKKSTLFADFKAVQNNNVWTTDSCFFQATGKIGFIIEDIHKALTGDTETTYYLKHLD